MLCSRWPFRAEKIWCTFVLRTNIIFHGNQYIVILHHAFMAIDFCNVFCNLLLQSEKEPSECYIILSRPSKILFPWKPIVWCVGWIDKVYSGCTIWCTIFLIKPFEVHNFLWCMHAPKVFTRCTKNRAPEFQILSALSFIVCLLLLKI